MTLYTKDLISGEAQPVQAGSASQPWWTWVLPFFVANAGTWLSIWFKTGPGASLWYLPTALGIVMVYWWGPRALIGVYLNAVVCAPLWDLPRQWSFLYALPETIEVGLSWLFFKKFARGKYWLPDLRNVGAFLLLGSFVPTSLANTYLVIQLYLLGDIAQNTLWDNWRVLFSGDMATQFVLAIPVLIIFTRFMNRKGWTQAKENVPQLIFLPENRNSFFDIIFIATIFVSALILIVLVPIHDLWILYGLLMILIAIRYGVNMAVIGTSWIGALAFLLPAILTGKLGLSTAGYGDFLTTNLDILFLCGVSLITGRAISDLFAEITERKQSEENLVKTEAKYRTLVEQIPPIVYIASPDQHIGVTYISPRIEALGFVANEWIADPELWVRQLHPDDLARVMDEIERNKQSGKPFSSEYRLIARDGRVRWFVDEAIDIVSSDGKLLYRQGFMLDITARKIAEESLFSRERYLELLNDITRSILLSKDITTTLYELAVDMAKLIDADDCYITQWDEEEQLTIPTVTTASLSAPYSSGPRQPNELSMTASVMKYGRALAADDVFNSPFISPEIAQQYPARSILGIPLIAREHKLGAAILAFNGPHHFTTDEIERSEQAGRQIALALQYFQQRVEVQQRLKESNALAQIGRVLSATEHTGTGSILQLIVNSALDLISQAEESVIHLLDPEEQVLIAEAVSGFAEPTPSIPRVRMKLGEGVAGQVINHGITINIGDIENDPRFIRSTSQPNFRSLLVAPVQSGGAQIGTISVQSDRKYAFTAQDVELLKSLGIQAAIAIENTRLFETTQQQLKEVDALYKISQGLVASLDADQLIKDVVLLLQQNFGYYHVQIYSADPVNGDLILKGGSGSIGQQLLEQGFRLSQGTGIVGHVTETAEPFVTNNVNAVVFFARNPLLPDTQSELTVPIKVDGSVVGVLDIQHAPPNRFTGQDLPLMIAVAGQLAVALQKANLYKDLQIALQEEQAVRSQLIQNERLALVGRLLASVSHELNNPLQAIQNALFLLKDETQLSAQAGQDLNIILSETERMAALIERLRSTYRPIRRQDFEPVELNNLIEDVHALIATHMRHKEVAFEFVPDLDLPIIMALSDQIRQVVLNLFLNAIEVVKPGGRLAALTFSLPQQNEVLLIVRDTGPGIDAEILPRIFEPFITSKYTGTGLGLTITHDIIQQHHGRIEADNNPDGGAIFRIWLPVDGRGGA